MNNRVNEITMLPTQDKLDVLWGQAVYDMSVDEVTDVVPNAVRVIDGGELANGARELLRESPVAVLRWLFRCSYYFLQGRLSHVMLTADHLTGCLNPMDVFQELRRVLSAKYGPPIHAEESGEDAEATWVCCATDICVSALGENNPIVDYVNIVLTVPHAQVSGFRPELADEARRRGEELIAWVTSKGPRALVTAKTLEKQELYHEALAAYDEIEGLSAEGGFKWGIAESFYGRARIYAKQGRLAEAIAEKGTAIGFARDVDDRLAREAESFFLELENVFNTTR